MSAYEVCEHRWANPRCGVWRAADHVPPLACWATLPRVRPFASLLTLAAAPPAR